MRLFFGPILGRMRVRLATAGLAALACSLALPVAPASAQIQPLEQRPVDVVLDSGEVTNRGGARSAIFSEVLNVQDASWVRLMFDRCRLGAAPAGGEPTVLRLTSLADGAVQHMRAEHVVQWQMSSAYFNGGRVLVELLADPGAAPSRVEISFVLAGSIEPPAEGERSICGPVDDRELSSDPRTGRLMPIGCTAWMIDDANKCFLTAGHCTGAAEVMEFNVPLSNPGGGVVHPGPEDQYAVDPDSMQTNGGAGVGNDYAYFGCFPNTETGLTPAQAQGDWFVLADQAPDDTDRNIRITGYGTTSSPVPPQWNQVQKTHVGPYVGSPGTNVQYSTDTTGGNSGSPVIDESTGLAIGIHTHAGCGSGGGANNGTAIEHPGLQAFLANPQGVCIPNLLEIAFPSGRPELVDPSGGTSIDVTIAALDQQPDASSARLFVSDGGPFVEVVLSNVGGDLFSASVPPTTCGADVEWYVSVETTSGETVTAPFDAPDSVFNAVSAVAIDQRFADDFELDLNWVVTNSGGLTDGAWERGEPAGGGDRGDPGSDADGSGACYVTDNADGNSDVDDGTTTLTSPPMDATDPASVLEYWRWYSNSTGADPGNDLFVVEFSSDGGITWNELEVVGPDGPEADGGWEFETFTLADVPGFVPSAFFHVRFVASDLAAGSVVEAAVDGVRITVRECGDDGCAEDLAGDDGMVGVEDLLALLAAWGPCGASCNADLDGSGSVDTPDLLTLLAAWGPCP